MVPRIPERREIMNAISLDIIEHVQESPFTKWERRFAVAPDLFPILSAGYEFQKAPRIFWGMTLEIDPSLAPYGWEIRKP